MIKKIAIVFSIILAFILGLFVEKNFDPSKITEVQSVTSENIRLGGYKYVSPLLECEQHEGLGGANLTKLEVRLNDYVDSKKATGELVDAAIYFRELKDGGWFGINEREGYTPASLLKVPVMLAYFKAAEEDESILDNPNIFMNETEVIDQEFDPQQSLEVGKSYTNMELIERLIKYSDNDSLVLLGRDISSEKVEELVRDIGMTKQVNADENNISVRSYASVFRVLYNASYLSAEYSEKALSLLADSAFVKGIRKGVPENIEVAHKFGQRDINGVGVKQLHDCGIVYHPNGPYLLCIMTRGYDYDALGEILADISKTTYDSYSSKD